MNVKERLLDLLFPPKCPFCEQILEDPRAPLCPACQPALPWLTGKQAQRKVDFADGCYAPLAYSKAVPEAFRRYKFGGVRAYGEAFSLLMCQCAQEHLTEGVDLVTWAPLSRKRMRERGFDQTELLARKLGSRLSLPVEMVLEKTRHTQPQSDLKDESARRANALGAYALLPGTNLIGKRVLLVDDVVTSGATLSECARVLKLAGAQRVWCVTFARAKADKT